jgi:hypothetical protein
MIGMTSRKRHYLALFITGSYLALIAMIVGACFLVARMSLQAESTLHAIDLVFEVVGEFLENNERRWPKSWDELATIVPKGNASPLLSPDDISKIRQRVKVNFDLTTPEVAAQDEDDFNAIEPIGPHYPPLKETIRGLLKIARRFTAQAAKKGEEDSK